MEAGEDKLLVAGGAEAWKKVDAKEEEDEGHRKTPPHRVSGVWTGRRELNTKDAMRSSSAATHLLAPYCIVLCMVFRSS